MHLISTHSTIKNMSVVTEPDASTITTGSILKVLYVRILVKTFQNELKRATECEEITVLT